MKPSVSVIVLVYKAEQFIERCAQTLFGQTLANVEYVFVDDCTPDASMEILDRVLEQFPARQDQVRILHNDANRGQAFGRRRGVEAATGEYIIHCDSDDWMDLGMLEGLYQEAQSSHADVVVCALCNDEEPIPTKYDRRGEDVRDFILDDMVALGEIPSLCRYLVKRDLYSRDIVFPVHNQGEDLALMVQLLWNSNNVYCFPEPLYHWRSNEASITRNPSKEGILRRFEGDSGNARLVEDFLTRQGVRERFADQLVVLKLNALFDLRPLLRKGECVPLWRSGFPELKGQVLRNPRVRLSHKVEYLIVKYFPTPLIKLAYKWRSNSRS